MERKLYKSIRGGNKPMLQYLKEVYDSLNLAFAFARRDLKVQYAQTYLGILWSVLQPLTALLIFGFFFRRVVPLRTNVPYSVFVFTGILGWFYFTGLIGQAGTSLMSNQLLIKKIQFPLLVLPLAKALVGLAEFSISLVILVILLFYTGNGLSARIIYLPLAVLANVFAGLSVGIWLSAFTIRFRDLHHIIPYLIGFGIWLTPVFYPTTTVPVNYKWIYYFHPVASVIALYRWIFIGLPFDVWQFVTSFIISLVLLFTGLFFFIRNEKFVADYL
jgi:lipopolysaccharide transport system permease protein